MTSPDRPNWSLLPHDPVGFFELVDGFDRRDLKRRYNQLIRQFKPEKYPAEFQKIRAAYESLDLTLRYGGTNAQQGAVSHQYKWITDDLSGNKHASDRDSLSTDSLGTTPLHERVRSESVETIYQELNNKKRKIPFDFYSLAVMADVVEPGDGLNFCNWLLKGLATHPNDQSLLSLLYYYVHGPIPDYAARKLLVACSQSVPEVAFFQITEPLWQALLREEEFSVFQEILGGCEANLSGINIDSKLIFTIHILKHAIWKADVEWVDRQLDFIEKNFERIPPFMDYDLELLFALRGYVETRSRFLNGNSLRGEFDRAVQAYFTENQLHGDRSILECQDVIMQDFDGVCEAFPELGDHLYEPFHKLWSWISYDVAERCSEPRKVDEELWRTRVQALVEDVVKQAENSAMGLLWHGFVFVQFVSSCLCYLVVIGGGILVVGFCLSNISHEMRGLDQHIPLLTFLLSILIAHKLKTAMVDPYWEKLHLRVSEIIYRRDWRAEVRGFLFRSHIPFHTLTSITGSMFNSPNSTQAYFHYYLERDFPLTIYAISLRFVV